MKQKILRFGWLIIAVMVLAFAPKEVQAKPTVTPEKLLLGDGSESNPYQIKTKENLYWFAEQVNNRNIHYTNAILVDNIIVNEDVLNPDGSLKSTNPAEELIPWTPIESFVDTFDGQGHTISGLYFNDINTNFGGLFSDLWSYWAVVKNIGVIDSYFYGDSYIGGVCGYILSGTIENCYSKSTVSGDIGIGGVCGYNLGGTIENCYNTGTISGNIDTGGVCGFISRDDSDIMLSFSQIKNCYNYGSVKGKYSAGGVCGQNDNSFIANCYYLKNCVTCDNTYTICTEGTEKTANEFASGEVAWLLNGCTSEGNLAWRQKVTSTSEEEESKKQPYPVFDGDKVFYSNDNYHNHYAYCSDCGGEPKKNDNGYYEISNAQELYWFAEQVNGGNTTANAILTADIVLYKNLLDADGNHNSDATNNWIPIGKDDKNSYKGIFDGQGHTVSGIYCNDNNNETEMHAGGFFGTLGDEQKQSDATIKNVGVVDSYFAWTYYTGGICGDAKQGTISNCYNAATVISKTVSGGVCGSLYKGIVENSHNTGRINGMYSTGGVCGAFGDGMLNNCYNTGIVSGEANVEGIMSGGVANVGGVCGVLYSPNKGPITNCYNIGAVSATGDGTEKKAGGICGRIEQNGSVDNCYYLDGCVANEVNICTEGTVKNAEAFACGEVVWLLNGNSLNYGSDEVPTDASSWKWYQKLGSDKQPVLQSTGSNTVYAAKKKCSNSDLCGWANSQTTSLALEHEYGEEITLSGKADENTQNLHSYIQTCTTPDCGATKVADENKKVIKGLNVDDDQIEITRENRNAPWKTTKNITLSDDPTKNMYHAPVEFMANGVSYTRQISDGYCWATVCLPYEISISNYTNKCKFYELSGVETDKITLTEITEETTIAAGTPVFVKANEGVESITFSATGETKMLKAPTTGSNAEDYTLTGVFDLTTLPQNSGDLFIKNDKMWDVSQVADKKMKVKIFRAYLKNNGSVSGAPQRSIAVDGEATAINDALDTLNDANAEYYDMSGRRINSLQKGVNIIRSGNKTRKVIIK